MRKDFENWNKKKEAIHEKGTRKFYHAREVWWCALGVNIGFEQDGGEGYRRPVVILKSFGADMCLVVPLTTSVQEHPLRFNLGEINGKNARALLSQIRVVDTRRLVRKIGYLEKKRFEIIRKTARDML